MRFCQNKQALESEGFSIVPAIYGVDEITRIKQCLEEAECDLPSFMRTEHLFAIRELLENIPSLKPLILNENMRELIESIGSSNHFISKAIYFDKPAESNWFVAYHQDLSISVNQKETSLADYTNWTKKRGVIGVQPPLNVLENTITLRIHLDDTNAENGALRVIPTSHLSGVLRKEDMNVENLAEEVCCSVDAGGIMLMKPLTFHASNKTTNNQRRRVIHLEICDQELASSLEWKERMSIRSTI